MELPVLPSRAALLLALTLGGGPVPIAVAQTLPAQVDAPREYRIDAGPLEDALTEYARQAGVALSLDSTQLQGLRSSGLRGRYSVPDGFAALLAGSPYGIDDGGEAGYRLRRLPAASGALPVQLAPLTVTGKGERGKDAVYEKLGSISITTREEIDRVPATTPRDLFTGQAGVYVMDGNQDPGLNINIRGIQGPGRNNVMIDGTRQNASNYSGYAGQISRVYVDPELIGGIDIEKGPSGGAGGAGVIGGVVNIRTLSAQDLIAADADRGARLRLIRGSKGYNTSGSAAGAIRLPSGLELTGGISSRDSDNYHAGKRGVPERGYSHCYDFTVPIAGCSDELPLTYQRMLSALAKAKYAFGDGHSVEVGTTYYRNDYASWQSGYTLNERFSSKQQADTRTYQGRYSWRPVANPWVDLRARVWKVDATTENTNQFERYGLDTVGLDISNTSRLATPWGSVQASYGGEFHRDDASTEAIPGLDAYGRVGAVPGRMGLTGEGKRRLGSVFGQLTYLHADWLQIDLGLRRDEYGIRAGGSYKSFYGGQDNVPFKVDRGGSRVNPRIAVGVTPLRGFQVYASYSEGYRPPSLAEVAAAGAGFASYNVPNPTLRAEIAKSREIGVNVMRDRLAGSAGKLRVKLAYFDNRYADYITRVNLQPYGSGQTENFSVFTYTNLDSARFRGYEMVIGLETGPLFVDLNYTRFDKMSFCQAGVCREDIAELANNGQPYLPPKSSMHGTVGARLLERKLTVGLRVRRDDKRGLVAATPQSQGIQWAPYTVYDLFASYAVNRHLTLGLSVENLSDKYYVGALSVSGVPAPGRNAKATLTYVF